MFNKWLKDHRDIQYEQCVILIQSVTCNQLLSASLNLYVYVYVYVMCMWCIYIYIYI